MGGIRFLHHLRTYYEKTSNVISLYFKKPRASALGFHNGIHISSDTLRTVCNYFPDSDCSANWTKRFVIYPPREPTSREV